MVEPERPIFYWNTLGEVFCVSMPDVAFGIKRLLFNPPAPGMSIVGDFFLNLGLFILDFGNAFLRAGTTLLDLFDFCFKLISL